MRSFNVLFSAAALLTAMTFTGQAHAADRKQVREKVYLGELVDGHKLLKIRKAFGGLKDYKGWEIKKLKMTLHGLGTGGKAKLLVNGEKVGKIKDFTGTRVEEEVLQWKPKKEFIIGDSVKKLQVEVTGKAYMMDAVVVLREPAPKPARQVLRYNVSRYNQGKMSINLSQFVGASSSEEKVKTKKIKLRLNNFGKKAQFVICGRVLKYCGPVATVTGRGDKVVELFPGESKNKFGQFTLHASGTFDLQKVVVRGK